MIASQKHGQQPLKSQRFMGRALNGRYRGKKRGEGKGDKEIKRGLGKGKRETRKGQGEELEKEDIYGDWERERKRKRRGRLWRAI